MSNETKSAPMELNGIRLRPETWRKIERLAVAAKKKDRSEWLREQIESLLSRIPDLHDMHSQMLDVSEMPTPPSVAADDAPLGER